MQPEPFWTPEELWTFLKISRRTLFNYLTDGRIPQPTMRVNKRVVRWRKADLEQVLRDGPQPIGTYGPGPLFGDGKLVQQEAAAPPPDREQPIVRREPPRLLALESNEELRKMIAGDGPHARAAGEELMRREGLDDDVIARSQHFRREFGIGSDQVEKPTVPVAPPIAAVEVDQADGELVEADGIKSNGRRKRQRRAARRRQEDDVADQLDAEDRTLRDMAARLKDALEVDQERHQLDAPPTSVLCVEYDKVMEMRKELEAAAAASKQTRAKGKTAKPTKAKRS